MEWQVGGGGFSYEWGVVGSSYAHSNHMYVRRTMYTNLLHRQFIKYPAQTFVIQFIVKRLSRVHHEIKQNMKTTTFFAVFVIGSTPQTPCYLLRASLCCHIKEKRYRDKGREVAIIALLIGEFWGIESMQTTTESAWPSFFFCSMLNVCTVLDVLCNYNIAKGYAQRDGAGTLEYWPGSAYFSWLVTNFWVFTATDLSWAAVSLWLLQLPSKSWPPSLLSYSKAGQHADPGQVPWAFDNLLFQAFFPGGARG
jgi:hypothetical protein